MAGWALGLAIVPCCIGWFVAIGLSIAVLVRSRDGREHGRGLAIAALCVACGWILVAVTTVALGLLADLGEGVDWDSEDPKVGDCFDDQELWDGTESDEPVDAMPCSQAHQFEAFDDFALPDGEYPGDEKALDLAFAGCRERFQAFVGSIYQASELDVAVLWPDEDRWDYDRNVLCVVYDPAGKVTGSLADSER